MYRQIILFTAVLIAATLTGFAQQGHIFKFASGSDMFFLKLKDNEAELERLHDFVERNKTQITGGQMSVQVDGYSIDLKTARIRSNRVKSEMVVKNGLKEEHFTTANHAERHEGEEDVVVVTFTAKEEKPVVAGQKPEPSSEVKTDPQPESKPGLQPVEEETKPVTGQPSLPVAGTEHLTSWDSYRFSLRSNLLYDAFLAPNLGLEWRMDENWAVKLDAGGGKWGGATGYVQKLWFVNPEIRYHVGSTRRFYVGVGGNYAKYNVYKGVLGNIVSKDTGYQGEMRNAGATAGYQLPLAHSLALNFNLGLGYNSFSYDSFELINNVRVKKERGLTKHLFGPTQAGVSLVWKFAK